MDKPPVNQEPIACDYIITDGLDAYKTRSYTEICMMVGRQLAMHKSFSVEFNFVDKDQLEMEVENEKG